ncbi:MAG TPA: hypothetical protein EYO84_01950, partial [Planctomycetes bacterium]|nr:hypothetical protein [Planctomycetota bacterium]
MRPPSPRTNCAGQVIVSPFCSALSEAGTDAAREVASLPRYNTVGYHPVSKRGPKSMQPISSLHLNTARSWRGGERQTLLLLEGLLRRGHQAALVCPPDTPLGRRATAEGISVHALSMRGARDLMKFRHLVRELNPQIIQYHTAHAHSSGLLARIGLGTRSKTIVQRRVGFSIHRSGFPGLTHLKYGR